VIALEAAACYAQELGKPEIRVQPVSTAVEGILRDGFGFTLETPKDTKPFFRRHV
jgi:hypothetical protein